MLYTRFVIGEDTLSSTIVFNRSHSAGFPPQSNRSFSVLLLPVVPKIYLIQALNERGMRSGTDQPFTARYITRIHMRYGLKPRYDRLRDLGMLTLDEIAQLLAVHPKTVKTWVVHGLVRGHAYSDKPECLYEPPRHVPPRKAQGMKLSQRMQPDKFVPERFEEVQCEA